MVIVCTIGARGGSKGVKNKNIRPFLGKPLLAHTIRQAREAGIFKAIAFSSDSEEILAVARQYGADYLISRPPELATDFAGKLPAIKHCFGEAEKNFGGKFDIAVDLDVTSPLRTSEDIVNCVNLLVERKPANVITGAPARRSPYFNLVEVDEGLFAKLSKRLGSQVLRRQDAPKCYDMNASIYVWWRDTLLNSQSTIQDGTILYEMPEERSLDIDSEMDFEIVEMLARKRPEFAALEKRRDNHGTRL
jgi:CMP-N-acetylneuraminic acid synthetase